MRLHCVKAAGITLQQICFFNYITFKVSLNNNYKYRILLLF